MSGSICQESNASDPECASSQPKQKQKLVLHFSRLPTSRPLQLQSGSVKDRRELEPDAGDLEKVERAKQKEHDEASNEECSDEDDSEAAEDGSEWFQPTETLIQPLLPAPKQVSHTGNRQGPGLLGDEVFIDLGSFGRAKEKPRTDPSATAWLVQAVSAPEVTEGGVLLPESILKHPMLRGLRDELDEARTSITHIKAEAMKDPSWQMSSLLVGQPGFPRVSRVPSEVSMYEAETWETTAHANPTRHQKRKHQINWLAHEAMQQEAEMLDRCAWGRMTKAQTQARYGW